MTNTEIMQAIKAEIERRLKKYATDVTMPLEVLGKVILELKELLSFLSTLESEKPMNLEGLEEEIERYFPESAFDTGWNYDDMQEVARHFAQWGYLRAAEKADEIEYNRQRAEESVPKDLEEAAERFSKNVSNGLYFRDLRVGFIAGAEWQKEQMMKEAVCYIAQPDITATGNIVIPFIRIGYTALSRYGIKVGDKVRIIILPKEAEQ